MGIRFNCPNGHKLNVKEFLAGKRGVCPQCGAKFVIPIPSEVAAGEVPLSVGSGLSQSVEIAVAPTLVQPTVGASPSAIIPVTEVELGTPELELPPAIREQPAPAADPLPTSIVAAQAPTVSAPVDASPEAVTASKRERSRRNQIVISFLLLGLVIVLAGILVWVLKREVTPPPAEKTAALGDADANRVLAIADVGPPLGSHSRVEAL